MNLSDMWSNKNWQREGDGERNNTWRRNDGSFPMSWRKINLQIQEISKPQENKYKENYML